MIRLKTGVQYTPVHCCESRGRNIVLHLLNGRKYFSAEPQSSGEFRSLVFPNARTSG